MCESTLTLHPRFPIWEASDKHIEATHFISSVNTNSCETNESSKGNFRSAAILSHPQSNVLFNALGDCVNCPLKLEHIMTNVYYKINFEQSKTLYKTWIKRKLTIISNSIDSEFNYILFLFFFFAFLNLISFVDFKSTK